MTLRVFFRSLKWFTNTQFSYSTLKVDTRIAGLDYLIHFLRFLLQVRSQSELPRNLRPFCCLGDALLSKIKIVLWSPLFKILQYDNKNLYNSHCMRVGVGFIIDYYQTRFTDFTSTDVKNLQTSICFSNNTQIS